MKHFSIFFLLSFFFIQGSAQVSSKGYINVKDVLIQNSDKLSNKQFVIFPEVREKPIQWIDSLQVSWLKHEYTTKNPFVLKAQSGEYFVFQIGVWAVSQDLKNLKIRFSDLKGEHGKIIPKVRMTCFNTGGIDYRGRVFTKGITIPRGQVQALWMGIDLPASVHGDYRERVSITINKITHSIPLRLDVNGPILENHGFDEGRRLSRMKWLNSKVGKDDFVSKGYLPVTRKGKIISILGRSIELADNGLPKKINTFFTQSNTAISSKGESVIAKPFHFIIEKEDGERVQLKPGTIEFTSQSPSFVSWQVTNTSDECNLICKGKIGFDGFVDYQLTVDAKRPLKVKDIRLEETLVKDRAIYMMGLNKPGGLRPARWEWKWDTTKNQDALWLGAVNGGLRIKWKGPNYVLPLVNVYYAFGRLHLPPSWSNGAKGGVHVYEAGDDVIVNAYSGPRNMERGEKQYYDFELLITPFKTINKKVQYDDRYYHSGKNESAEFIHEADSLGANIITIHQGNDIYPFINYPFSDRNTIALKKFIDQVHQDNKRVKVYYTTRELTVNLPELWPFVSMNGAIIYPGPGAQAKTVTNPGGPNPWLIENFRGRRYIPAWVAHFDKGKYAGMQDLSLITRPDSRLNNFYLAGLDWMVSHWKIDGIYIDDCSMDRTTIRRARKILDDHRPDARIDMHSWNHFNKYAGWASCLNLYMDLFPYIDQVWIGEGRNYDTPPDYWLVEISGLPFGLSSQMLEKGGNPWRGMVYGMTNRAGWSGTPPDPIWKFWDEYDIMHKTMIGYWDQNNPVNVDNDSIRITVYKGENTSILAIGNFSQMKQQCSLQVDFNQLGYDKNHCVFSMPEIARYQRKQTLKALDKLSIPANKGFLVVIKQLNE